MKNAPEKNRLYWQAAMEIVFNEALKACGLTVRETFWKYLAMQDPDQSLPVVAAAVAGEKSVDILKILSARRFADWLPAAGRVWYEGLVAAWENLRQQPDPSLKVHALRALVRLDSCWAEGAPRRFSRLSQWLTEARMLADRIYRSGRCDEKTYETLEALAAWRPGDFVFHNQAIIREWAYFWDTFGRSTRLPELRAIAIQAQLNLGEEFTPVSGATGECLLYELAELIPQTAGKTWTRFQAWQPVDTRKLPAQALRAVAEAWLECTGQDAERECRMVAWNVLADWERAGVLNRLGMELSSRVAAAVRGAKSDIELLTLARWLPDPERDGETGAGEIDDAWRKQQKSGAVMIRLAAWVARIRLRTEGYLQEKKETRERSFQRALLQAIGEETSSEVLHAMSRWVPGPEATPAFHRAWLTAWQTRIKDNNRKIDLMAGLAMFRLAVERNDWRLVRQWWVSLWCEGWKEVTGVNLARFARVLAALNAGDVGGLTALPAAERAPLVLGSPPTSGAWAETLPATGREKGTTSFQERKGERQTSPETGRSPAG